MSSSSWDKYFREVYPKLGARGNTFKQIFNYLDEFGDPFIIETGTYREENNYTGDGCSTLLFDTYLNCRRSGELISIDIDPDACKLAAKSVVYPDSYIACSDSVEFLGEHASNEEVSLLYLDSYNITDWNNDWAPAAHHLKELFAAKNVIGPGTLIVVDDNIKTPTGKRLGKGRLIYELMDALGIEPLFDEYQIGWIWSEEYE
jgi:hypothetical protein